MRIFRTLWIALAATVGGCATVNEAGDAVIVPTRLSDGIELTSSVRGALVVDQGCLKLRRENGALQLLVWPEGTRFAAGSPGSLTDAGGRSRDLGVPVEIQGGFASRSYAPPGALGETLSRCGGGPVFLADRFMD